MKTLKNAWKGLSGSGTIIFSVLFLSGCGSMNPLDGLMDSATEKVESKAKEKATELALDAYDNLKDAASDKLEDVRDDVVDKAEDIRDDAVTSVRKLADSDFGEYSTDNDVVTASTGMVDTTGLATRYGYSVDNATGNKDMEALRKAGVTATYKGEYAASSYSVINGSAAEKQHDFKGDMRLEADFGAGWIAGRSDELVDGTFSSGQGVQVNGAIDGNSFAGSSNLYDVTNGNVSGTGSSNGTFAGNNGNQVVGAFETVGTMGEEATVLQGGFGAEKQASNQP